MVFNMFHLYALNKYDCGGLHLGLAEEGIYRVNGNTRLINDLRNTFDKSELCVSVYLHLSEYGYHVSILT